MSEDEFGLAKVLRLYDRRRQRAEELRAEGRKVVGYYCCYPPVELLTALDLVPFRIQGNVHEPVSSADAYLETTSCSFVRSCFDLGLTGYYDFLDAIIFPHSCDTVQRLYDIWRRFCSPKLCHFLDVPHMVQPSSFPFFKQELLRLQAALEELAGKKLEAPALRAAVALHNENRALLRQLYDLRKLDAPLIAGSAVLKLIVVGGGMPVVEYNHLVRQVISEAVARKDTLPARRPRVMVYGSEIDDADFFQMLEEVGVDIVIDDICTGTRSFWPEVLATDDSLDGIAGRYLNDINCPRTYRPQGSSREADLENRFGYLDKFVQDFRVDGIVSYIIRFCDTHELEVPDVIEYFADKGMPILHLEEEYRVANVGQIKTRVEAFLERVGVS